MFEKRTIFALLLLTFSSAYGQETIGRYPCILNTAEKSYIIQASQPKRDKFSVYIYMYPVDKSGRSGGLIIESSQLETFKAYLKEVKTKFEEWSLVANENQIEDVNKEIKTSVKYNPKAFFKYGDFHIDLGVILQSNFIVNKSFKSLTIYTGELNSFSNQYIKCSGYLFYFDSPNQIDELINILEEKKILDFFSSKATNESVFK